MRYQFRLRVVWDVKGGCVEQVACIRCSMFQYSGGWACCCSCFEASLVQTRDIPPPRRTLIHFPGPWKLSTAVVTSRLHHSDDAHFHLPAHIHGHSQRTLHSPGIHSIAGPLGLIATTRAPRIGRPPPAPSQGKQAGRPRIET